MPHKPNYTTGMLIGILEACCPHPYGTFGLRSANTVNSYFLVKPLTLKLFVQIAKTIVS